MDFSPDGKQIASCGSNVDGSNGDKQVRVWDTETGREKLALTPGPTGLTTVAFSPDGSQIAAGSFDTNIYLWGLGYGE